MTEMKTRRLKASATTYVGGYMLPIQKYNCNVNYEDPKNFNRDYNVN